MVQQLVDSKTQVELPRYTCISRVRTAGLDVICAIHPIQYLRTHIDPGAVPRCLSLLYLLSTATEPISRWISGIYLALRVQKMCVLELWKDCLSELSTYGGLYWLQQCIVRMTFETRCDYRVVSYLPEKQSLWHWMSAFNGLIRRFTRRNMAEGKDVSVSITNAPQYHLDSLALCVSGMHPESPLTPTKSS
jgi:hypothetical protein